MDIVFDMKTKVYYTRLDPSEAVAYINTPDIVEARDIFLGMMKGMFDNAVQKKMSYKPESHTGDN